MNKELTRIKEIFRLKGMDYDIVVDRPDFIIYSMKYPTIEERGLVWMQTFTKKGKLSKKIIIMFTSDFKSTYDYIKGKREV